MEAMIHNGWRQQPITSDEACRHYRDHLARLEAMIRDQEDIMLHARTTGNAPSSRTSLRRLVTKCQGVVDALATYQREQNKQTHQTAKQSARWGRLSVPKKETARYWSIVTAYNTT